MIKNKNIAPDAAIAGSKISGTLTGNTLASPVLSGSVTGTYTLAGTPTITAPAITAPTITGASSISGGTIGAMINSDIKRCSTATVADQTTTLANITGLTGIALVASGVYDFEVDIQCTSTTNAGIGLAFKFTTATLTSIQCKATALAASSVANAAQTTTATDAFLHFNSKTAAWLQVRLKGTMVVNAAGTVAVQMAQETSHTDVTTVLVGSTARFTRIA